MLIGLLLITEAYNIYACNGILFNHESPLRGENFVTRKITKSFNKNKIKLTKLFVYWEFVFKRLEYAKDLLKCDGLCFNKINQTIMLLQPVNNIL